MRKIGILGGMGPEATILLQRRLLEAVDATDDADHIPLLIDMNPQVPSRLTWILENSGADPGPVLASMAKSLEQAGAKALAMPCNTAHYFANEIQQAVTVPLFNMPELAAARIAAVAGSGAKIGILASPATQTIKLFKRALAEFECEAVYPDDQSNLLKTIRDIKAHGPDDNCKQALQLEADKLVVDGVKCLVIGCSEFSLLSRSVESSVPLIDTLDVLVERLVEFSGANGV